MSTFIYDIFIKFGTKEHMEKLFKCGEVYLNTIDFYQNHEDPEVGDKYEGTNYIRQIAKISIADSTPENTANPLNADWQVVGANGQMFNYSPNPQNLYCLFGVESKELNKSFDPNKPTVLVEDFVKKSPVWDTCCIIHNPKEFNNRVEAVMKEQGYKLSKGKVEYYNPETLEGSLTPFMKIDKYSHQKEVRYIVDNPKNEPITIHIGSIKDIAYLRDAKGWVQFIDKGNGKIETRFTT